MAGKCEKPEEIPSKLRQVAVLQGQGKTVAEAIRQIAVTEQTYDRWQIGASQRHWFKRDEKRTTEWAQTS